MKKTFVNLLLLTLCFDLVLAPFPKTSYAETLTAKTSRDVPSPDALTEQTQKDIESLMTGPNGPVTFDKDGKPHFTDLTDAKGVHDTSPNSKNSFNANDGLVDAAKRFVQTDKLVQEAKKSGFDHASSTQCPTCGLEKEPASAFADPKKLKEGQGCSKEEKLQIAKDRKEKKECSKMAEFKSFSMKPISAGLKDTPKCLDDMKEAFKTSMVELGKATKGAAIAAGNYLFSSTNHLEEMGTSKAFITSGVENDVAKTAAVNGSTATDSLLEKFANGAEWVFKKGWEFMGYDTEAFAEIDACTPCGQRINSLCAMAGVLGKDIIKQAIIAFVTVGAFKAYAIFKRAKKPAEAAIAEAFGGKGLKTGSELAAERAGAGRVASAMVRFGETFAPMSKRAADAFESFAERKIPGTDTTMREFMTKVANGSFVAVKYVGKKTGRALEIAQNPLGEAWAGGSKIAKNVVIESGPSNELKAMAERKDFLSRTPGRDALEHDGRDTLANISDVNPEAKAFTGNHDLRVIVPRSEAVRPTEEMDKVLRTVKTKEGTKFDPAGFHNQAPAEVELSGDAAKVGGDSGEFVPLSEKDREVGVKRAFQNSDPEARLSTVVMNDGRVKVYKNGELYSELTDAQAKHAKVETNLGDPNVIAQSDKKAVLDSVEASKSSELPTEVKEEPATSVEPAVASAKVKATGPGCGPDGESVILNQVMRGTR